jgi:hypothetical protein
VVRLLFAIVPLFGVLGQLHFAVRFANDGEGVIKGVYLHFAAISMYAFFGIGVGWLWRRRWGRPIVGLECLALLGIAAYTLACRWP